MTDFARKRLKHGIPEWVADGAIYFITINAKIRGKNTLANKDGSEAIKAAIQVYTDKHKWYPKLAVVMPDHLHLLLSLNTAQYSIKQLISPWKSYLQKTKKIDWQEGFFEHRIRDRASLEEKEHYLWLNPVRASLVDDAKDWHYTWRESDFQHR